MSRRTLQVRLPIWIAAGISCFVMSAGSALAAKRTIAPTRQKATFAEFKLTKVRPAEIESATLLVGTKRLKLKVSVVRRAAVRGVLKVKLPKAARRSVKHGRKQGRKLPRVRLLIVLAAAAGRPGSGSGGGGGGGTPLPDPFPGNGFPVIAAAGDVACDPTFPVFNNGNGTADECRHRYTASLLAGSDAVLALGDESYGYENAFQTSYDPSWGAYRSITRPIVGDHEYDGPGFANLTRYMNYFGPAAGPAPGFYYSFDVGSWHIVALNSMCPQVSCAAGSDQVNWLAADLAADTARCTLLYWHHPHFSDGPHVTDEEGSTLPFWSAAIADSADVILHGNDHNYQRWPKIDATGTPAASGIRQFVVGTGGKSHTTPIRAEAEVRNDSTFGVLKLRLRPSGYDWRFIPEAGFTFADEGSDTCNQSGA